MNLASVLMCWNIPRISEDLLYELFSNAGPIEEISFAKNGKSCFIVYEHADAVVTAKDIFKDVRLDGRPLNMFDQDEISKLYSQQEEQNAQNWNHQRGNDTSRNFNSRSYEGPYHQQDGRVYSNFNRNAYDRSSGRYPEVDGRNPSPPSNQPPVKTDRRDWRSSSMRNTSGTSYSSNSAQCRPDLLPTPSQPSKARNFEANSINDLLNSSNNAIAYLMNPYNTPVTTTFQDVLEHLANRSAQPDYHGFNADLSGNFMHGLPSRGNQDEFEHSRVSNNSGNHDRHNQRNKYDSNHSHHYRDHPYRDQVDREPYGRGLKFTNSSPGANYRSRNSGERDHKYQKHQNYRSRRR